MPCRRRSHWAVFCRSEYSQLVHYKQIACKEWKIEKFLICAHAFLRTCVSVSSWSSCAIRPRQSLSLIVIHSDSIAAFQLTLVPDYMRAWVQSNEMDAIDIRISRAHGYYNPLDINICSITMEWEMNWLWMYTEYLFRRNNIRVNTTYLNSVSRNACALCRN